MGLETGSDVALAFGLVIAAGFSTIVGASLTFCTKLADKRVLAISLGSSAGVMMYVPLLTFVFFERSIASYVSFGEIFLVKSVEDFTDHGYNDDEATRYATFCFFAGVIFTAMLNALVYHFVDRGQYPSLKEGHAKNDTEMQLPVKHTAALDSEMGTVRDQPSVDPSCDQSIERSMANDANVQNLQRVGLVSGLAIALHNFPEGLATFVATLADPTAGAAVAFAIVLHNIPEGVVVAMPVYYATKSRMKGFFWAFLSGVSEPIGAILGWLALSNMGDLAYAVLFGLVAGIMIYISLRELIPTALMYDPEDKYVTWSVFVGMAVMASSLLLFNA